jgi:hypothetical protein
MSLAPRVFDVLTLQFLLMAIVYNRPLETAAEGKSTNDLGCAEFSNLKVLKFACSMCTVGLSSCNLKPYGLGCITVEKLNCCPH